MRLFLSVARPAIERVVEHHPRFAFNGRHDWFWRSRGDAPVSLIIRTSGTYTAFERLV
jgi:hypothetical protein